MRDVAYIVGGIAVALAWLAIWAGVLHLFGIPMQFGLPMKPEARATRRERLKQLGKLRYILIVGVLGRGLGFGLALTAPDFFTTFHGWAPEMAKLLTLTLLFGWFQGTTAWSETIRNPVPFPPIYPPAK